MQQIVAHERCVGCGACMNGCPKQCITMVKAEGGFLYPSIDQSLCVDCGHCQTVCPALHHEAYAAEPLPKAYAAHHLEDEALEHCSSGGIFQLLAQDILQRGGAVFGAAFDDSFQVTHRQAETWEEAKEFQSSKYVQSTIGTAYRQAKSILDSGRPVLFTGTPCQISGLKLFLGKDEPNLLCQDIICHSIPSPKVWADYLNVHTEKHHCGIKEVQFRKKEPNWEGYHFQITFSDGSLYNCPGSDSSYMRAFLNGLISRPACYSCPFKGLHRASDLTLADFWGVQQVCPSAFHAKGTSLVLLHTQKAVEIFQRIFTKISAQEVDPVQAVSYNPAAVSPCTRSKRYAWFWAHDTGKNLDSLVAACLKPTLSDQLMAQLRKSIPARAIRKLGKRMKRV